MYPPVGWRCGGLSWCPALSLMRWRCDQVCGPSWSPEREARSSSWVAGPGSPFPRRLLGDHFQRPLCSLVAPSRPAVVGHIFQCLVFPLPTPLLSSLCLEGPAIRRPGPIIWDNLPSSGDMISIRQLMITQFLFSKAFPAVPRVMFA